ncbi:glycosyl hydrolase [Pseudomonas sp. CG7]|uniref:WD40/YVTN/BNR-like repeat-containing protein n=1 Tax=Pseudomonas sp. CG7 TaxID=191007 RepID=UPI002034A2D3|nr:YCF48-related protein [Pseudomonas sp. CG7]MCM2459349.1 glycosyl hydrolase [Pseudomonas sp. CG7]
MKNHRYLCVGLLSLGLLTFTTLSAQPYQDPLDAPSQVNRLASSSQLTAVGMAGQRIVAVGARGMILLSDDQGNTWQQANVPVSSDLVAVQFTGDTQGWAVGHDGVVLHSADAGATWVKQLDGRNLEKLLTTHFGELAAKGDEKAQQYLDLIKLNFANGPEQPFLGVWFEDEQNGFAVGAFGTIVQTRDGGKTWESWIEKVDNPEMFHYNAIAGIAGQIYISSEQGAVFKLDRAQQRFVKLSSGYTGSFFGLLGNQDYLLAFGLRGNAYKSVDEGQTWSRLDTANTTGLVAGVIDEKGRILLASVAGAVIESRDQGNSFKPIPDVRPALFAGLTVAAPNRIVVVGLSGVQVIGLQ